MNAGSTFPFSYAALHKIDDFGFKGTRRQSINQKTDVQTPQVYTPIALLQ